MLTILSPCRCSNTSRMPLRGGHSSGNQEKTPHSSTEPTSPLANQPATTRDMSTYTLPRIAGALKSGKDSTRLLSRNPRARHLSQSRSAHRSSTKHHPKDLRQKDGTEPGHAQAAQTSPDEIREFTDVVFHSAYWGLRLNVSVAEYHTTMISSKRISNTIPSTQIRH